MPRHDGRAPGDLRPVQIERGFARQSPAARGVLRDSVAAVSAGIVAGEPVLDLDYAEDSTAAVDLNVVRLGRGGLVEVQGTGESGTFSRAELGALLDQAEAGLDRLGEIQRNAMGADWPLLHGTGRIGSE